MESSVINEVWRIAEPVVMHEGMEIVDIEFRREARGKVLRFFLHREGGVSLEDLAPMSRRLSDLFDVHDIVPGAYTLELSSPGINRRLRNPVDFRRYLDKRVRVRCVEGREGRRSFLGLLRAVEDDGIVVEVEQGPQFIAYTDIEYANYEHVFDDQVRVKPGKRSKSR